MYSFRDLVGLRTVAALRREAPLQELRKIGAWLKERHEAPWSALTFYRAGKTIYAEEPDGSRFTRKRKDQSTIPIAMERIASEMATAARKLRTRSPTSVGQVNKHRSVLRNQTVIAGTRIPTARVLEMADDGVSIDRILKLFPLVKRQDVKAAILHERSKRNVALDRR